jgi:hypothetical protein
VSKSVRALPPFHADLQQYCTILCLCILYYSHQHFFSRCIICNAEYLLGKPSCKKTSLLYVLLQCVRLVLCMRSSSTRREVVVRTRVTTTLLIQIVSCNLSNDYYAIRNKDRNHQIMLMAGSAGATEHKRAARAAHAWIRRSSSPCRRSL